MQHSLLVREAASDTHHHPTLSKASREEIFGAVLHLKGSCVCTHMNTALGYKAMVDILAKNMALPSPFQVKLDGQDFQTLG